MARQRIGRRRLLEQRRRLLQPAAQLQQQREQAAHAEDDEQPTEERVHERAAKLLHSGTVYLPWYGELYHGTSVRQRARRAPPPEPRCSLYDGVPQHFYGSDSPYFHAS